MEPDPEDYEPDPADIARAARLRGRAACGLVLVLLAGVTGVPAISSEPAPPIAPAVLPTFAERLALTEPLPPMGPPIAQRRTLVRYLAETPDGTVTDVPVTVREPPPDLDHVYFAPPTYPVGRKPEPHITILKTVPVPMPASHGILRSPPPSEVKPAAAVPVSVAPVAGAPRKHGTASLCDRYGLTKVTTGRSWHCSRR